jgi:hypothetical protein
VDCTNFDVDIDAFAVDSISVVADGVMNWIAWG